MAKKQCNKGWGCGGSCISRKKTCRSNLGQEGKLLVENFSQYISRLGEEQSNRENEAARKIPQATPELSGQAQRLFETTLNRP